MDKSRESSSPVGATGRFGSPPIVLGGFLLLLALVFMGSYALGAAVGPIGPASDAPSATSPTPATEDAHHGGHS